MSTNQTDKADRIISAAQESLREAISEAGGLVLGQRSVRLTVSMDLQGGGVQRSSTQIEVRTK